MFTLPMDDREPLHDRIRLADWVELNLIMEKVTVVSSMNVADELVNTPPDNARASEDRSEYEDPEVIDDGQTQPGFWVTAEAQATSAFHELIDRTKRYGAYYPVEIDEDVATLRQEMATHEIGQFLVLLRARQLYGDALKNDGPEAGFLFEELLKHALGTYIGSDLCHRVRFGTAGGTRGDGLPPLLEDAVRALSSRMYEEVGEIPDGAEGDYRADAVSWKPFGDKLPGQLVIIGQATISEGEWKKKEPANRWTDRKPSKSRLIRFLARPLTAVAFPETLSLTSSEVLDGLSFSSIPFDRLRLLSVLRDKDLPEDLQERMKKWICDTKNKVPL